MGRRGRKRQLDLESEYWRLISAGVGTVAACRAVGITRKTGYRWRAETGGIPSARLAEPARAGRYLSLLERQRISTLRERGHGVREIARRLDRSPSTISRELKRNMRGHARERYDGDLAHARSRQQARRVRSGRLSLDPELREPPRGVWRLTGLSTQPAAGFGVDGSRRLRARRVGCRRSVRRVVGG